MSSGIIEGIFPRDNSVTAVLAFSETSESSQGSNCDIPVATGTQRRSDSTRNRLFDAAIIKVTDDSDQIFPVFPK
jgi:hypothetical protein